LMTWWTKKGIINNLSTNPYIYIYIYIYKVSVDITFNIFISQLMMILKFVKLEQRKHDLLVILLQTTMWLYIHCRTAKRSRVLVVVAVIMVISLGTKQTFDDWTTILQEPILFIYYFLLCPWVPPPYLRGGIYLVVTTEVLYIWGRERERERSIPFPLFQYFSEHKTGRKARIGGIWCINLGIGEAV
jgi:hypothetical protein